ncbi:transferase family protein [Beauveria bassiana ARSEF 2860]|uniref:Transferase family protein n=1 Tax=Beauveria bassiana (strain ARSEF 2860) TaxID=655819 RepID=J4KLI1_BEAB2|nr:transferase family protein [Beauveria bassiana ARSEF 2860]EJP62244.1 transferase family protein [Beauveria bassiana ARSEF 2860]
MHSPDITVKSKTRIQPQFTTYSSRSRSRAMPLSLLDATTASFALTSAIWVFGRPTYAHTHAFYLADHLCRSFAAALDAFPHWAGQIKAIQTTDGQSPPEVADFPVHARRFGRVYAKFGDGDSPGVDVTVATSSTTAEDLHPSTRTTSQTLWQGQSTGLYHFTSPAKIADPFQPDNKDDEGLRKPVMAVQITELACGGFVLAIKIAHPLADIIALVSFVKHWAKVSHAILGKGQQDASESSPPVFDPAKLDAFAAGNINSPSPDAAILAAIAKLPLHRYDWWQSAPDCPWPVAVPEPFKGNEPIFGGELMPFSDWDIGAPVSHYVIHYTKAQITLLSNAANRNNSSSIKDRTQRLSQHDALLGHVWSCIARARNLSQDARPIHCDLVYGVRPALQLGVDFVGSPILMINIELPGADVAGNGNEGADTDTDGNNMSHLGRVAGRVRETIGQIAQPANIAKHLHSVAYESTPQRIWQAFLGRSHILVTTWARSGIYDVDFGLGSAIWYVDGVVPDMDGTVVIKEAPPPLASACIVASTGTTRLSSWTENGVDVSVRLRTEDMQRLLADALLFPSSDH